MNIKRIINLFFLLMLSLFIILACTSGRGGSYTEITYKSYLYETINGCTMDYDNYTIIKINEDGELVVVAYFNSSGTITDTTGKVIGYIDVQNNINDTNNNYAGYIDSDNVITIINDNEEDSDEESEEEYDEIKVTIDYIYLDDYISGETIDNSSNKSSNPNFLITKDDNLAYYRNKVRASTSLGAYLVRFDSDNEYIPSGDDSTLSNTSFADGFTFFIGSADTSNELQRVYVKTTIDEDYDDANNTIEKGKYSYVEIITANDGVEQIYANPSLIEGFDPVLSWSDNNDFILASEITMSEFNITYASDNYHQMLSYNPDVDGTYNFHAYTYRNLNGSKDYMLNVRVMPGSASQNNQGLDLGFPMLVNYSELTTKNRPRTYFMYVPGEHTTSIYDIVTLGDGSVSVLDSYGVSSNNVAEYFQTSSSTSQIGINYFRKTGSFYMELVIKEVNDIDNKIILETKTVDAKTGETLAENEEVVVDLETGEIIKGNYLLFYKTILFTSDALSNISNLVGAKFLLQFNKGEVMQVMDVEDLIDNGTKSYPILQINGGTTFHFPDGLSGTQTLYTPKMDDNGNITYKKNTLNLNNFNI